MISYVLFKHFKSIFSFYFLTSKNFPAFDPPDDHPAERGTKHLVHLFSLFVA
jgi:hypothetical protein